MTPQFEQFMREEFAEHEAEGVLDDDMGDRFEEWISEMGSEELDKWAQKFGQLDLLDKK